MFSELPWLICTRNHSLSLAAAPPLNHSVTLSWGFPFCTVCMIMHLHCRDIVRAKQEVTCKKRKEKNVLANFIALLFHGTISLSLYSEQCHFLLRGSGCQSELGNFEQTDSFLHEVFEVIWKAWFRYLRIGSLLL